MKYFGLRGTNIDIRTDGFYFFVGDLIQVCLSHKIFHKILSHKVIRS